MGNAGDVIRWNLHAKGWEYNVDKHMVNAPDIKSRTVSPFEIKWGNEKVLDIYLSIYLSAASCSWCNYID